MPDYDAGFKIVARHAGQALARLAGVLCDHWEPLTGEVQATERLADRVFRARRGRDKFVVYMEAYTRFALSITMPPKKPDRTTRLPVAISIRSTNPQRLQARRAFTRIAVGDESPRNPRITRIASAPRSGATHG